MSTVTVSIPKEYGLVLAGAAAIGFHSLIQGGVYVGALRRKLFGDEFRASDAGKAVIEEHKKATGEESIAKGGYPDVGSGRYSAALPYADWLAFNNAQRAHGNYVEGLVPATLFPLIAGLHFPKTAAGSCLAYIIGREIYARGYAKQGADKRMAGAIVFDLALLTSFSLALCTGLRIAGGRKLLGL